MPTSVLEAIVRRPLTTASSSGEAVQARAGGFVLTQGVKPRHDITESPRSVPRDGVVAGNAGL